MTRKPIESFWDGFWFTLCILLIICMAFMHFAYKADADRLETAANDCVELYNNRSIGNVPALNLSMFDSEVLSLETP